MAVATMVAVGVVVTACGGKAADSSSGKARDVVRTTRPGYGRSGPSIADPAALVSRPTGRPVTYKGRPVVQACGLVTPEDLRQTGMLLFPNSLPGAVSRIYFDGQSQERLLISDYSLEPFVNNRCDYTLARGGDRGLVSVAVYQTSYAAPQAMNLEVGRARPGPTVAGADVWVLPNETSSPRLTTYLLGYKDALVELRIEDPSKEHKQALLRIAAKRLVALTEHPAGPIRFRYDSPTYVGAAANGCELTDAATFRAVFHTNPSPLVEERVASAVAVGTVERNSQDEFNYIAHDCVRRTVAESLLRSNSLRISIETFEHVERAQRWFAFDKTPAMARGVVPVSRVGDEAFYADARLDSNNRTLEFRKGRAVVVLGFTIRGEPAGPAQERIRVLTSVAQMIVKRMADF